jgi:hydroxymethylpyrimidine/phosphomethylpyrimidine kinase
MATRAPPTVMVISMLDPSGASLLGADQVTLAAMGCHALSVCTGIALRDTLNTHGTIAFDADWVSDQIATLVQDIPVDAFKIGALPNTAVVAAVAAAVSDYPEIPLVLDPVLEFDEASDADSDDNQLAFAIRELLVPQATLVCANEMDLSRLAKAQPDTLLDTSDDDDEGDDEQPTSDSNHAQIASKLIETGSEYVIVSGIATRGASSESQLTNEVWDETGLICVHHGTRIAGQYKGAGDTLTAALAAALAANLEIKEALAEAGDFVHRALKDGYRPGMGALIPDRLFWAIDPESSENEDGSADDMNDASSSVVMQVPSAHA